MILDDNNATPPTPQPSAPEPAPGFFGDDYTIRLREVFQGPMDLLLHLVREQEVEIHEIKIARVIDGYLAYLDSLVELDVEYAGDFLVMAATLMAIKSRSLLPHDEIDLEDEFDPKDELIERLIEYRRTKEAADDLHQRHSRRSAQFERGWRGKAKLPTAEKDYDLTEVTVWDLLSTFSRLMRETMADRPHEVETDPRPMRFYMDQVVFGLRQKGGTTLRQLMRGLANVPPREALVGSFIALLELSRLQLVTFRQESVYDDIAIELVAGRAEEAAEILAQVETQALQVGMREADIEAALNSDSGPDKRPNNGSDEAPDSSLPGA